MSFKTPQTIRTLLWSTPADLLPVQSSLGNLDVLVLDVQDIDHAEALQTLHPLLVSLGFAGSLYLSVTPQMRDDATLAALTARIPIAGFVLRDCAQAVDIEAFDALLRVVEAQAGCVDRSLRLLAEVGAHPQFFLEAHRLAGLSTRMSGLILNESALARTLPSQAHSAATACAPLMVARGTTVLGAAAAGICAYLMLPRVGDIDMNAATALADGFGGLGVHEPEQLAMIASA